MDLPFADFGFDTEEKIGVNFTNMDYNNLPINISDDVFKNLCEDSEDVLVNWTVMILRILVCVLGILGNFMVFFVILVLGEYKKAVTHWYVLQLAIADTLFLLTIPFKMVEDIHGEWIFTRELCKFKEAVLFLNYFSSILFLVVMSIDRYIAVCHGFSTKLQKFRAKRSAYIITFIVWSISLVLCIPIMLYSEKSGFEPHCSCVYEFPDQEDTTAEECSYEASQFSNESLEDCIERKESESTEFCKKLDCDELAESFKSMMISGDVPIFHNLNTINETNITTTLTQLPLGGNVSETRSEFDPGCSYKNTSQTFSSYLIFNFVVMFIFPLIVLTACYSLIALKLREANVRRRRSTRESTSSTGHEQNGKQGIKRLTSSSTEKARKNRIRVTYVCFSLVLLFIVCWLPFHAVHMAKIRGVANTTRFCADIATISSLIAYLNSALNPYVYNFTGKKFRKRLRTAVKSIRRSRRSRTSSASSAGSTPRYISRKRTSGRTSGSNSIHMTKIYKSKSESDSTHKPSEVFEESKRETQTLV